jgi:hypothetical protein
LGEWSICGIQISEEGDYGNFSQIIIFQELLTHKTQMIGNFSNYHNLRETIWNHLLPKNRSLPESS